MAREREGFFSDYDPADLAQQATLTCTQKDLVLIRTALGVWLEETSRHDHVYNDIRALIARLPVAPERKPAPAGPARVRG